MSGNPFDELTERLARIEAQNSRIEVLLQTRIPNQATPIPAADRPLNISEAAEFLSLTKGSLYGKVHKRELPFRKQGKRVYFDRDELIQWIDKGRIQPTSEIEKEARQARIK